MKTFGILTLTHDAPIYNFFDKIKRQYYINNNVDAAFVYNTPLKIQSNSNNIYYKVGNSCIDGIYSMFDKFIFTLKQFNNWLNYDYIIRANSSTFINIDKIYKIIQELPNEECYAGYYTYPGTQKDFVSGTCIIFSKDIIRKLAELPLDHFKYHREDDLIIFDYMNKFNILKTFIPMYWYDTNIIPNDEDFYMHMEQYPLLRIKNSTNRDIIDTHIWGLIESKIL